MAHKICPICGTPAHEHAVECGVCGASLENAGIVDQSREKRDPQKPAAYDSHYGETDLSEGNLRWQGGTYILIGMLAVAIVICVGGTLLGASRLISTINSFRAGGSIATNVPTQVAPNALPFATNTVRPTLFLPTVTDAPPTRTLTPTPAPTETPGPCMQEVQPGDSLIMLVSRCGHRDLAIIQTVLEINDLDAPEVIQVGQTLEIPWPTGTPDPESNNEADDEAGGDGEEVPDETSDGDTEADSPESASAALVANNPGDVPDPFSQPTETLQPGVTWHTIASGENIISIAVQYGANIKILSELNPEITFAQCDFGMDSGGPNCSVFLIEGQRMRVPAPTPTPTLSPTPSGSETPTPTPTPTFNAPSSLSPGNRVLFRQNDLITLRWVASGTLAPGQIYRVVVEDVTFDETYLADTTDLFFVIPEDWQGRDGMRHEFQWTVSVIDADNPTEPYFTTEPRTFIWESRDES